MIPGMTGAVAMTGGTRLTEIAFFDGNIDATDVAWPAGVQAGDVAVLLCGSSQGATDVVPSGWNAIIKSDNSGMRGLAAWRICDGNETGDIEAINGSGSDRLAVLVFRGNIHVTSVSPSAWNGESTTGNPASQSVLASAATKPCIVFGFIHQTTSAAFSTATPAFDSVIEYQSGPTHDADAGYKIYNADPQDHTIDADDTGSFNTLISGYLELE